MKLAKVFSSAVIVFLLLSSVVVGTISSAADISPGLEVAKANSDIAAAKPSNLAAAKTPPVVAIGAPLTGTTVSGSGVLIEATAEDDNGIKKVEYAIDGADWVSMSKFEEVDTYAATWNSTGVYDGSHTITVRATDARNAKAQDSVTVTTANGSEPPLLPPAETYELFVEIDYLEGHAPTEAVLDYIEWYYMGNNPSGEEIEVTFSVSDITATIPTSVDLSNGINDKEFWAIEDVNNGGNDRAYGDPNSGVYDSKEKWVLYGTSVEGSPNTMGYCYITTSRKDLTAGNYILIADESTDDWEINNGVTDSGAEATVLMHELGHSIGIAKMHPVFGEQYDPDSYSVMSYLSIDNASQYDAWYYSASYWDTRNLEYYTAS